MAGNFLHDELLTLDGLVMEVREKIIELLPPGRDRIRAAASCTALRAAVARADARLRRVAPLAPRTMLSPSCPMDKWLSRFGALRSVALAGHATDALLARLAHVSAPPTLTALDVSQSPALTDAGVLSLFAQTEGRRAGPWRHLRSLDVTFCARTTYGVSLMLRGRFAERPVVVRRLPDWLQGCFHTPWGEMHTYYADGSFTFDRNVQAAGFVRWLSQVRPQAAPGGGGGGGGGGGANERSLAERPFLADSLQYIDFVPPPTWPPWMRFVYRPGVALCPYPQGGDGAARHVIVAQLLRGLRAPTYLPPLPLDALPVGGRLYWKSGEQEQTTQDGELAESSNFHLMLSCMPVTPLRALVDGTAAAVGGGEPAAEEAEAWRWLMPPAELHERLNAFEVERKRQELPEAMLERVIAAALSAVPGGFADVDDPELLEEPELVDEGGMAHAAALFANVPAESVLGAAAPAPGIEAELLGSRADDADDESWVAD